MPLTEKGEKIKHSMQEQYGKEKGTSVFYASKNKGTITGVDAVGQMGEPGEKAMAATIHKQVFGKDATQATMASAPSSGPAAQSRAAPSVPRWTGKVV